MTIQTQIPNRVKVGAVTYPVALVDEIVYEDGSKAWGDIDFREPRIQIATSGQAESRRPNTFLHEVVHAILERTGDEELNTDEAFVSRFANQLAQVFVDNGWTFGASEKGYEVVASGDVPPQIRGIAKDTFVHEGVEYRKVARWARVGEFVLAVANKNDLCPLRVGRVGQVDGVTSTGEANIVGSHRLIFPSEYVVLEPLAKGGADHGTI